jgi:hypothetical protein
MCAVVLKFFVGKTRVFMVSMHLETNKKTFFFFSQELGNFFIKMVWSRPLRYKIQSSKGPRDLHILRLVQSLQKLCLGP